MVLLATFVPSSGETEFDLQLEAMKSFVGICDCIGIYLVINERFNRGTSEGMKILSTGLGWGSMENIAQRLFPLWINARAAPFDWSHLLSSLNANFTLVRTRSFSRSQYGHS